MAMEAFNSIEDNEINEINETLFSVRKQLKYLEKQIKFWLKTETPLNKEKSETEPDKNYQIINNWSEIELKVNKPWDEKDKYWLTIKKVNWKFVFDVKREWPYTDLEFNELRKQYTNVEMKDDENINKINLYLSSVGIWAITDENDINTLKNLLENLPNNVVDENN